MPPIAFTNLVFASHAESIATFVNVITLTTPLAMTKPTYAIIIKGMDGQDILVISNT